MHDETQERYVFWRMAQADFQECKNTLYLANSNHDNQTKLALIKSAIIAYSRPFSGNDHVHRSHGKWKIDKSIVPDQQTHEKVQEFRNNLIAHSSVKFKEPKLARIGTLYPIKLKGHYFEDYENLVDPLLKLANNMIDIMMQKIKLYEKDHLDTLKTRDA